MHDGDPYSNPSYQPSKTRVLMTRLLPKESPILLEEFKSHLMALTHESKDDDITQFGNMCQRRESRFFHLGSRDEFHYGISLPGRAAGRLLVEDEDPYIVLPESDGVKRTWTTFSVYFVDEMGYLPGEDNRIIDSKPVEERPIICGRRMQKEPNLGPIFPISPLTIWNDKEKTWTRTRFIVVKSLHDNKLWIVSSPYFVTREDDGTFFAVPNVRAFSLDGFQDTIACACLKLQLEDFEEWKRTSIKSARKVELKIPDHASATRLFDLEQIYSGAFVLEASPAND
ncbi:hypothetical protein EV356DRAFT_511649 [Viridothelium virens]|uniref:Uncharacterized protein n=1 Tax=Viridothelium virens TaxID=1048519 RepID=A0A6A6GU41_VIRVR|nr:hypothetical protein EV356DRAFT_511649 [Viridothelium virens]